MSGHPFAATIPRLVAHRGNAHEFPENTLPALRSALELGASCIEFDVHLTVDQIPVVMHDASLKRCAGIERDALEMDWAELREIGVGEPQRFGDRYADVCIPSLAQVVELLSAFPNATAFVELKRSSLRKFGHEFMVQRVSELLRPIAAQIVLISFDLPTVNYVQQVSRFPVGWVLAEYSSLSELKAGATVPNYLFCDYLKLPKDQSRLWRGPWHWAIYEVTTRAVAQELMVRGAQLLETMEVRSMLRELRALRQGKSG